MSNFLVAFLFAIGGGGWIYSKMMHRTGGNTQNALVVAILSGGLLFLFMLVVMWTVAGIIDS